MQDDKVFEARRRDMIRTQLETRGITDARVLAAMAKVERHCFVPDYLRDSAYTDNALPLREGQTISQPYIVALMTQCAAVQPQDKVLEIGTGSGYQTAVLAELTPNVYSIEINKTLAEEAKQRLLKLGYSHVHIQNSDGASGWPQEAPFDAILVTAAPDCTPPELIRELKTEGRLVIPVGRFSQNLFLIEKHADNQTTETSIIPVRFVPLK